jgi:hypothetical protein
MTQKDGTVGGYPCLLRPINLLEDAPASAEVCAICGSISPRSAAQEPPRNTRSTRKPEENMSVPFRVIRVFRGLIAPIAVRRPNLPRSPPSPITGHWSLSTFPVRPAPLPISHLRSPPPGPFQLSAFNISALSLAPNLYRLNDIHVSLSSFSVHFPRAWRMLWPVHTMDARAR